MIDYSKNVLQRGLENIQHPFLNFIRSQETSSLLLLISTIAAMWWANSVYFPSYQNLLLTKIDLILGDLQFSASLKYIINDGLMVIFFFFIGLEIKREMLAGDLAQPESRRMLILCALGGMACPALIYYLFNWSLDTQHGWGIPMATDTAFALGVLIVVRKHIPHSLLAFFVGLAIVDDIGAILVIAIFYTQEISPIHLAVACALIVFLAIANYAGVRWSIFYIVGGVATWWMMLKSGVHPTLAGVAVAFTIPARPKLAPKKLLGYAQTIISAMQEKNTPINALGSNRDHEKIVAVRDIAELASAPLRRWEDALEKPVALFILPLFVLANAGIPFHWATLFDGIQQPIGAGIITGLILGKFIGISGTCWLVLRCQIGHLPQGLSLQNIIGVSLIAGIGFTMSTFVAALGFDAQPENLHIAKTSIMVASILAALLGILYILLLSKIKASSRTP